MRQAYLRYVVALIIVGGHLGLLVVIVVYMHDIIDPEQVPRLLLSLGPVATMYLLAVVKTAIDRRYQSVDDVSVSLEFSIISIALFAFFVSAQYYFCLQFPNTIAHNVASLAEWIQTVEVALAGSLGLLVDVIFPSAFGAKKDPV